MTSSGAGAGDDGSARETTGSARQRTELATTRTALAVGAIAVVLVRVGAADGRVIDVVGGALAAALAGFVTLARRRRLLRIRLTAASTVVIAAVIGYQAFAALARFR